MVLATLGSASAALMVVASYGYITSNNYFVHFWGLIRPTANVLALAHMTLLLVYWATVLRRTVRSAKHGLPYIVGLVVPAAAVGLSPRPWDVCEWLQFVVAPRTWWVLPLLAAFRVVLAERSSSEPSSRELRGWQIGGGASFAIGLVLHRLSASEPTMILLQVAAVLIFPCASLIVVALQRRAPIALRAVCGAAALFGLAVATVR